VKEITLFKSKTGPITNYDFLRALETVLGDPPSVLYMHTALTFGLPNPQLGRQAMLELMFEVFSSLRIATLCVPTFTFSFCNNEPFDVATTTSCMGALNEYIRKLPQAIRSSDPLMSVAMIGKDRDLVDNLGRESIGADSTFDRLRKKRGVKFLFFGPSLGDCCTYMHYLEWLAQVPYRYNRTFRGKVRDDRGEREEDWTLFVRYNGVEPNSASHDLAAQLKTMGYLKKASVGDASISAVDKEDVSIEYLARLAHNQSCYITELFCEGAKDDTFAVRKMVAL